MAGGTDTSTYKLIISSFLHLNEDKSFMKCLNLVSTIHSEDHNKDAHDRPYLIRNTSQINLR